MTLSRNVLKLLMTASCMALVLLILHAREASARCYCTAPSHSTGTDSATGSTCAQATSNLDAKLRYTAAQTCADIGNVCLFQMTTGTCFWNGSAYQVSGSATHHCNVCVD